MRNGNSRMDCMAHTPLFEQSENVCLRIVEMETSEVVLMERSDAASWEEQVKNVAHFPIPILDTQMYPTSYYRGPSVHC